MIMMVNFLYLPVSIPQFKFKIEYQLIYTLF